MGLGPDKHQTTNQVEGRALSPQLNAALERALSRLDQVDERFRDQRAEERNSQMIKRWHLVCKEIDEHLRAIAQVMIESHQLSLDMGSSGGARQIRPWLVETTNTLDRFEIWLDDNDEVVAQVGDTELLRGPVERVSYDWVEEAVVNWVLTSVDLKAGHAS